MGTQKKKTGGLRIEQSKMNSGQIHHFQSIKRLKEANYYVQNIGLDGDAPKEFIYAYVFKEGSIRKRSWTPYIAKSADKWYPHESVVEYMINKIGITLGLKMNEVELVVANGQIRFLSKYFIKSNEVLVHGAEICGEFLDDMDFAANIANNKKTSRQLFTFEFICSAIRKVFPESSEILICELVKMVAFDAIVGNNDRHFYNWGVINTVKKGGKTPRFAPVYDSARGLFWNESEQSLIRIRKNWDTGRKIAKYVQGAEPRISIEGNSDINHFGLIEFIKALSPSYKSVIDVLTTEVKEKQVLEMLKEEIYKHFSEERRDLISHVLKVRFDKLRNC